MYTGMEDLYTRTDVMVTAPVHRHGEDCLVDPTLEELELRHAYTP